MRRGSRWLNRRVWFHAPATTEIDLTRDNQPFRGPSEIQSVQTTLAPILQKIAPEDLTASDITYLVGGTGLNALQVDHFSTAASLAKATGIDSQTFYGLARSALPTDLTNLLATDPAAQKQAIQACGSPKPDSPQPRRPGRRGWSVSSRAPQSPRRSRPMRFGSAGRFRWCYRTRPHRTSFSPRSSKTKARAKRSGRRSRTSRASTQTP